MDFCLLLLFLQAGLSIKILTFEHSSENIAYHIIDKSIPLPEIFTLCLSIKEDQIPLYNSFFTIYGKYGDSWMTLSNFVYPYIALWLKINKAWMEVTVIPEHLMNSWIHVCLEADTITGNISVLVNEGPTLFFTVPELIIQTPENLKENLYIGQAEDFQQPKQYQGEVANFNIFSGSREIKNMMLESCEHVGDIVSKDTEWKRVGDVKERSEESWKICNNVDLYRVAIPVKTNWDTSKSVYKSVIQFHYHCY